MCQIIFTVSEPGISSKRDNFLLDKGNILGSVDGLGKGGTARELREREREKEREL